MQGKIVGLNLFNKQWDKYYINLFIIESRLELYHMIYNFYHAS